MPTHCLVFQFEISIWLRVTISVIQSTMIYKMIENKTLFQDSNFYVIKFQYTAK